MITLVFLNVEVAVDAVITILEHNAEGYFVVIALKYQPLM